MKKIIALLLALCLAASTFGCSGSNTDPATSTTGTTASQDEPDAKPVTYDSCTVTDEEAFAARSNVIATVGGKELTSGAFNVCYWMGVYAFLNQYGSYASLYGLDYTKPLDEQAPTGTEDSWQKFFIEDALASWHVYQALALKGEQMEIKMPDELQQDLDGLRDVMADSAENAGFDSVDAMIQAEAGAGCNGDDYYNYTALYYQYLSVMMHLEETTKVTQEDIDAYFTKNESDLAESGITKDSGNVFGVRHILIEPKGGTKDEKGNTTFSEAEWEACRIEAQKLMDEWAGGTATEETFSNYAKEHSADPGSKSNGGLYEDLDKDTSFVEPFKNWYLEEGRKVGDYGLVKTDYGYHIMYLSSIEAKWIAHCRDAIINDTMSKFVEDAKKAYPIETDYDKIVLAEVNLVQES